MEQTSTTRAKSGAPVRAANPSLAEIDHIVAIASGKGGVGKSTVAANLAFALKASGHSVGLLDADLYGPSQPGMLGATGEKPRVDGQQLIPVDKHGIRFLSMGLLLEEGRPIIWRAPIAMKMINQFLGSVIWGKLDFLLIDLPPGTGDVQLTLAQQAPLTGALIVTTPQEVALGVARRGLKMFEQVNVPILGIMENMSGFTCEHCQKQTAIFGQGGGRLMAEEMGVEFLGAIPLDPLIMKCSEEGLPVVEKAAGSPGAVAFVEVAAKLKAQIDKEVAGRLMEPQNVGLTPTSGLEIEWPDGHLSRYESYSLRKNCACASCIDEDTGKSLIDARRIPLDITVKAFTPVGRYALQLTFSDRHNTGIFTYERLRQICECEACLKERGSSTESFNV